MNKIKIKEWHVPVLDEDLLVDLAVVKQTWVYRGVLQTRDVSSSGVRRGRSLLLLASPWPSSVCIQADYGTEHLAIQAVEKICNMVKIVTR
jgi:hypothetical protein